MAGLGETTAALVRLRRQRTARTSASPGGLLSEIVDFGANPGELRMLVHAPPGLPPDRPLIVVLHGCTQSAEQYAQGAGWIELADRLGLALVCPEQRASNNPNRCFNWFEAGDIARGQGEAASIRSMIDAAALRFCSDRQQIFVTGLSAGGAMASVMLACYPELFAGGGIIAGLPYGAATSVQQAFAAMFQDQSEPTPILGQKVRQASPHTGPWPRISVWHGAADTTVKPSNADAIVRQWLDVHGVAGAVAAQGDSHAHQVWSRDGVVMVESRLIPGMGHGTPLSTGGPDGVGVAGPFLLEAGISSSRDLVRFWAIAAQPGAAKPTVFAAKPSRNFSHPPGAANDEHGVRGVINRALKAAGLMK
jgi:feruloyl esterase